MYNRKQDEALYRLNEIMAQLDELGLEAKDLMRAHFPEEMPRCDAYGVFDFGVSSNPYDTTFNAVLESLEANEDEGDE